MNDAARIFGFLLAAHDRGEQTALVTVTDVLGSSSRSPGTHMAVSESGASVGSLSGGCVEAAVVGEAVRVIKAGTGELIRFGRGSRFIDIRLPCGGGLDLMILPDPAMPVMAAASHALAARQRVGLTLSLAGGVALAERASAPGWHGDRFVVLHRPPLRLIIVGHGEETVALHRLATAHGCEVVVLTPDRRIEDVIRDAAGTAHRLMTPAPSPHLMADRDSAVVFLFHDHDWETELLAQALDQSAFFIGAMGSRATHRKRQTALKGQGFGTAQIDRIVGPIGVLASTRDPATLALSVLAQIVDLQRSLLQSADQLNATLKAA